MLLLLACVAEDAPLTPTWGMDEATCENGHLSWAPPTDDLLWVGLQAQEGSSPYWTRVDGLDADGNVTARCAGDVTILYAYK